MQTNDGDFCICFQCSCVTIARHAAQVLGFVIAWRAGSVVMPLSSREGDARARSPRAASGSQRSGQATASRRGRSRSRQATVSRLGRTRSRGRSDDRALFSGHRATQDARPRENVRITEPPRATGGQLRDTDSASRAPTSSSGSRSSRSEQASTPDVLTTLEGLPRADVEALFADYVSHCPDVAHLKRIFAKLNAQIQQLLRQYERPAEALPPWRR